MVKVHQLFVLNVAFIHIKQEEEKILNEKKGWQKFDPPINFCFVISFQLIYKFSSEP